MKGRFKQAADSLKESSFAQELFEQGDEPISTVGPNPGYSARTIDFSGVVWDLHQESRKKVIQEPVSTCIKCKCYSMPDTIETKLTVSSLILIFMLPRMTIW